MLSITRRRRSFNVAPQANYTAFGGELRPDLQVADRTDDSSTDKKHG